MIKAVHWAPFAILLNAYYLGEYKRDFQVNGTSGTYRTLVLFFYICPAGQPTTSNMDSQCVSISGAVRMGIYQAS